MQMINGTARWKRARKTVFHWEIIDETRRMGPRGKINEKFYFDRKAIPEREKKEDAIFPSHSLTTFEPGWLRKISLLWREEKFSEIFFLEVFSQQVHYDDIIIIAEHRNFHSQLDSHVCLLFIGSPLSIFIHEKAILRGKRMRTSSACRIGAMQFILRINHFCMWSSLMGSCDSYQGPKSDLGERSGDPDLRLSQREAL